MDIKQKNKLKSLLKVNGALKVFEVMANLHPEAAVFVVNGEREIVYWNRTAEELLGMEAKEILGQHCLKANRCQSCMVGCGLSEKGQINKTPLVLHRPDGRPVNVWKWGQGFFSETGAFTGGVEMMIPRSEEESVLKPEPESEAGFFHGILTRSRLMHQAETIVKNIGPSETTVLVRGESGSGKELIARAVHEESLRKSGPFLAVNSAAWSPALLESELFGHVKGAFTGAVRDHQGLFTRANGGTLFLDEVGELPLELQAKLLRVLEDGKVVPVGGSKQVEVDVRIVAATHRSLRKMVAEGTFREDLMYRLRVVPIFLPPLRERREDIDLLLWHFLKIKMKNAHRRVAGIDPVAMKALLDYAWPGNVRELQNVLDYALAVGRETLIKLDDLPPEFRELENTSNPVSQGFQADMTVLPHQTTSGNKGREFYKDEKAAIESALEETRGDVGKAAALLGWSRPTFWRKRKKWGSEISN